MANKRLNAVITIGGAVTGSLKNALGTTQRGLRKIGDTVRSLEREQKALGRSMKQAADEGRSISGLNRRYQSLTSEIAKARREQERMTRSGRAIAGPRSMVGSAVGSIGAVGAVTAAAGIGAATVRDAMDFETAMVGVAKQVDGARDKSGKLTAVYYDMAKRIQHLGREIPIATNELAGMAEAGARMGVAKKDLIDFTRVSAEMSTALQLPTAELADDMGKIANLYKMPIKDMRAMGDAINYLDDKSVAKGGEIIEFLRRTGGVAGSIKVTGKQMAALGSTLLSLGEPAESASTATNAMIQKFAAADKGTKKFRRALDEIGVSAADLQKGMQMDSEGTILKMLDAINRMPKEQRLGIMVDLVGLEHSDTLAKLVSGVGEYRKQIDLVNSQKVEGSMGREFSANLQTSNAQLEIAKNRVKELSVNLGVSLLPSMNDFLRQGGKVTSALADWTRENDGLVRSIGSLPAIISTAVRSYRGFITESMNAASSAYGSLKGILTWRPGMDVQRGLPSATAGQPNLRGAFDRAPPKLPASSGGRRSSGGTTVVDKSKHTWHITQQPGQSPKSLADEIEKRRKSGRPGSLLYDKPRGY